MEGARDRRRTVAADSFLKKTKKKKLENWLTHYCTLTAKR